MKVRFVLALAAATAWACGGGGNVSIDGGGPDATASDGGGGSDATASDGGGGSDATASDGGGKGDAAPTDGGGADGASNTSFACGNKTCDSQTDYCEITKTGVDAGLVPDAGKKVDAGAVAVDTCVAYPTTCKADGGSPSCSCIQTTCSCSQSGSDLTVTCP